MLGNRVINGVLKDPFNLIWMFRLPDRISARIVDAQQKFGARLCRHFRRQLMERETRHRATGGGATQNQFVNSVGMALHQIQRHHPTE